MLRRLLPLAALVSALAASLRAQAPEGTLAVAVAREALSPVPTLWRNDQTNREVSDLLFLRLADLGPRLSTTDEASFRPRLARQWHRRDERTLVFEIDPRARWHDGTPVTAADAAFALERARDPALTPQLAPLLRRVASVTVEGEHRLVVRFTEAYAEQLYDATYHTPPLPAHLLAGIPAESLATSAFVANPVGSGPYRISRRVPGQLLELSAVASFFLGRPGIGRIVFLLAPDPETRLNLVLSGQADATENLYSLPNPSRLEGLPELQYVTVPALSLGYATMNQRDPADTSRPHPLFADRDLRRALVLALDRGRIGRTAYGPAVRTPGAPISAVLARNVQTTDPWPTDTAAARRLLAARGWADHDGDGILDRDGRPLTFSVMVPAPVAARRIMAAEMQESWRLLGIRAELELVEPGIFLERRQSGRFDMEMYGVTQDPTPSGLTQAWSCGGIGGANVARYCNPVVDSLLARASARRKEAPRLWSAAARQIAEDAPAVFLVAQVFVYPVHRRFTNVTLRPESPWSEVWTWRLVPGADLPRDRR